MIRQIIDTGRVTADLYRRHILREYVIAGVDILLRPDRAHAAPTSLMIEPTNRCNMNCPTCPTGTGKLNRPKTSMPLQQYKNILDQAHDHLREITLTGYGEPFIHRDFLEMIAYARHYDIKVETSTNGFAFVSRQYVSDVIQTGLNKLTICLDGVNQETINRFRQKVTFFDCLLENIGLFHEEKARLGVHEPLIELQFIVMRHNENQLADMRRLANQLKVDIFLEKTCGINPLDPEFQELARKYLPEDLEKSRYTKTRDGEYRLKGKIYNFCPRLYTRCVICAGGEVLPCCYDLFADHVMGNVFEESLKSIWNHKRYRAFRRRVNSNRASIPICHLCSVGRSSIQTKKDILRK